MGTVPLLADPLPQKSSEDGEKDPEVTATEALMREHPSHAARENKVVFPAWNKSFSDQKPDEISVQFEGIEHKMFGKDSFKAAEKKITSIEADLGFSDLAQFTPTAPLNPGERPAIRCERILPDKPPLF